MGTELGSGDGWHGQKKSLEDQAVLPSWDTSVSGLGRTSKGSADFWEGLKQIPEVGWKNKKKNGDRV